MQFDYFSNAHFTLCEWETLFHRTNKILILHLTCNVYRIDKRTRFFWRTLLAEWKFLKVWSLQRDTKHRLFALWIKFFHIVVLWTLIYRTVKSRCANLIPLMIYGMLKWVQKFCHPGYGHNFHRRFIFYVLPLTKWTYWLT